MDHKITRRSFGQILGGVALGGSRLIPSTLAAPPAAQPQESGAVIFPYGTHIYREPHLPLDQLRSDMALLKKMGFTMVKIQESWSMNEQREGEINLETVAQVVSDARQNGLLVYFGVTMEQAPAWFWKKYPDASMVYETGQPHNDPTQYLFPADAKPGPCWYHPGAREAGIRFVEAVGREIGKYDNILVWNVWQEIGFWPMRPGHMGLCYCVNTLREFRLWLREKYQTIAELNRVWISGYADWDEIEPPRMFSMLPPFIDFRFFMDDVYLSFVLQWKAEAFRRSDPMHRRILAHVGEPAISGTPEWRYAEQLDVLGSSCYPAWAEFGPMGRRPADAGQAGAEGRRSPPRTLGKCLDEVRLHSGRESERRDLDGGVARWSDLIRTKPGARSRRRRHPALGAGLPCGRGTGPLLLEPPRGAHVAGTIWIRPARRAG